VLNSLKRFLKDENGMGTVEMVIIVAVLVGVALIFRGQITKFVQSATDAVFDDKVIKKIKPNVK